MCSPRNCPCIKSLFHQSVLAEEPLPLLNPRNPHLAKEVYLFEDQIFGSSYFKSLLEISDLDPLTEEIAKYVSSFDTAVVCLTTVLWEFLELRAPGVANDMGMHAQNPQKDGPSF